MKFRCCLFFSALLLWTFNAPAITVLNTNDSGSGSFRKAITDASSGETITFDASLSGQTVLLTSGQITVDKNLNIDASDIGGITIDGNAAGRILVCNSGTTIALESLTLTNGVTSGDGGAIYVNSTANLTLINSTLAGNTARFGGGIFNIGTVTLSNSTLSGNTASDDGGGIFNIISMTVNNATLSGNTANDTGGGIVNGFDGTLTLNNVTVSDNSALSAAGISSFGTLNVTNSIVAGNSTVFGSVVVNGSNNLLNGTPLLAPLGDYGGPTQTMPPLPGSPAINAGINSVTNFLTTDQRGFSRVVGNTVDIGAVESGNAIPGVDVTVVTTTNDVLGDLSSVSLRTAVAFAPANSTITFTNTLSGQTILLTNGQISVDGNLTIDASGLAGGIIIDGNANGRIFNFLSGNAVLESLTITNGATSVFGGAIFVESGVNLTLNNASIAGNACTGGGPLSIGGGIINRGTLAINNSTFSDNFAYQGGGIFNTYLGKLTLNNSTFSGNSAEEEGGGIYNDLNTVTINSSTLAGNTGLGGIFNNDGTLNCTNTIVAGDIVHTGFALFFGANNLIGDDPLLAPLSDYGGPTRTMPPLPGSPAINAGLNTATTSPTDQRGLPRIVGSAIDIGAVELQPVVVLNTNDSGAGSLRQAVIDYFSGAVITFTNTLDGQTILLTSGQILINGNFEIDASTLATGIIIDGNANGRIFEIVGNNTVVFDSLSLTNGFATGSSPQNRGGAIYVSNTADLTLNTTTLSGNSAFSGGGIRMNGGTLTLNDSTLSGNSADFGGGIRIFGGQLTLNNSTLADNSATAEGGGGIRSNGGQLTINNSTLSGNTAATEGGGIHTFSGQLTVNNSTLSGNSASWEGGGIFTDSGSLTLNSATLSGNSASDFGGVRSLTGTPSGNNSIVAGNSASFGEPNIAGIIGSNNLVSGDPMLAPLGDYGGITETMPPLAGSPAIDAGIDTGSLAATDQRGVSRVLSGGYGPPTVDLGAVEWNGWLLGEDLSGIDPAFLLPDSIYDGTTVFPYGFDPAAAGMLEILSQADKDELIAQGESNVTDNPATYGLYTESAFQALALDRPFLTYNTASNTFTLTIGILQAPDLSTTFSNLTGFTTIPYPGDGEIDIEFEPPNSEARFFEVYGSEPPSP